MSNALPQDTDNPNEPVGQIVPAPDEAEKGSWTAQLLSKGYQAVEYWDERVLQHDEFTGNRIRWGLPEFDDKWTKSDEQNYLNMDVIVRTFAGKLDDVARNKREVAYSSLLDSIVALGHGGEQYIEVTSDGGLKLSTSPAGVPKDAFGTVGAWQTVIIVVVISIAVAVAIWQIGTYLNNRISSAAASDLQKHTKELADKGYTPEQIAKQLEAERLALEAQKKDPNEALYSAIKFGSVIIGVVAVIGAGVWAAKTYFPPSGRSSNPVSRSSFRTTIEESMDGFLMAETPRGILYSMVEDTKFAPHDKVTVDFVPGGAIVSKKLRAGNFKQEYHWMASGKVR